MRHTIPLEKHSSVFLSMMDGGLTSKEALSKLKLKQLPATGQQNYQYWTSVWQQGIMRTLKDFLSRCNNKEIVPTLEAMQNMVDSYHKKESDMLKLGRTLSNLANICLHKSTTAKFYLSPRATRIYWRKYAKTWLVDHP